MSDAAISLTILAIVVALFIWNRWPVELVAIASAIALYATGVLTLPQALAGFGDPAVVLIAALFVVSEGLDATGVTTWVGQTVSQRAGSSPRRLLLAAMLLAAGLTALIGLNGTVAAMLPMMVAVALRTRFPTSRLLMPMAFAGSAGGMLLLTGSPVNVVISEAAEDAGVGAFGFAEFALAGIPLVVGTLVIVLLLGRWLLPDRTSTSLPPNLADQATTLIAQYGLDESVQLLGKDAGAAELVVPPRSPLVGRIVRPGQSVEGGRFIVLAVQRRGVSRGETRLEVGDAVLVEGTWAALEQLAADREVLVVDGPEQVRRQTVPLGRRSGAAIGILVAMVVMLATGIVPPAVAALLAAGAMVLVRAVTMSQAYRGISWSTVLLVAGMIPMATAITVSGAGDSVAQLIVGLVGDAGPLALLVALFVITVVFGQLISNTATALIMIPVAVSAAEQMAVSPTTVLMSLCVAAAAAFMTPVATPANMMVMAPGGYRFGDYWKLGLPMVALYFAVSVGLVPLIWRF